MRDFVPKLTLRESVRSSDRDSDRLSVGVADASTETVIESVPVGSLAVGDGVAVTVWLRVGLGVTVPCVRDGLLVPLGLLLAVR